MGSSVRSFVFRIALSLTVASCGGGGEGSSRSVDHSDAATGGASASGSGGATENAGGTGAAGVSSDGGAGNGGNTSAGGGGLVGAGGGPDAGPEAGACGEGSVCDDGDPCTANDRCKNGACAGIPRACDDGVACNGVERCDGATGACVAGTSTCGTDICDLATDSCTTSCSGCLVGGTCFPPGGVSPVNPCETCDAVLSKTALSPNAGIACEEDGNACKTTGVCNASGVCERTSLVSGTSCGALATPCRGADTCDGLGACVPGTVSAVGAVCTSNGHCAGSASAPACTCDDGYEAAPGGTCVDIDECVRATDDCDDNPDACVNAPGSFSCACPGESTGDGRGAAGCACARDDYSPSCERWTDVAIHTDHACGISGGKLYCWGKNDDGELGIGDKSSRVAPTRVGTGTAWTAVAPGSTHTCGILGGALYCWGGGFGRDLDFADDALVPIQVGTASDWVSVTAGGGATCGIRAGGALYCWGWDELGTTGTGGAVTYVPSPALVPLTGCTSVSIFSATASAVCSGKLYGWGDASGAIGDGVFGTNRPSPIQVGTLTDWTQVDRGNSTACAVHASGALSCWGVGFPTTPTLEPTRSDWASLAVGLGYACGLTTAGSAYCWGANDVGQVGDGTATRQTSPQFLRGQGERVAAGQSTTFGIFDGGLYSWGSNDYGVRGVPVTPRRVQSDTDWTAVASGLGYTCGIRNGGVLYCWGMRPGSTITPSVLVPEQVGTDTDWTHVDVGSGHACGTRAGSLYCWGINTNGALGDGTTTEQPYPVQVGTATDWLDARASDGSQPHTCGIRTGGALYCWGSNANGEVGDGSTMNRSTPTLVSPSGWSAVDLGSNFGCGVQSGGLFCWGNQGYSQLGNGVTTFTAQKTPVRDGTSATWNFVSTGFAYGCGLDGSSLYCWGNNGFGQAGITGTPLTPTLVDSSRGFSHLAAGTFSTCGTTAAGALYCWGSNQSGELGTGEAYGSNRPITAVGTSGWQTVAAGSHYFCAIQNGALYCWGTNSHGELGHDQDLVPGAVVSR